MQRLTKIILIEIGILALLSGLYVQIKKDNYKQPASRCPLTACTIPRKLVVSLQPNNRVWPETEITSYIREVFGKDADFGILLAKCESSLNPDAVSPSGKYIGLFQFDTNTWESNCDGVITNYRAQIRCTKKLLDRKEEWRWPTCSQKIK